MSPGWDFVFACASFVQSYTCAVYCVSAATNPQSYLLQNGMSWSPCGSFIARILHAPPPQKGLLLLSLTVQSAASLRLTLNNGMRVCSPPCRACC